MSCSHHGRCDVVAVCKGCMAHKLQALREAELRTPVQNGDRIKVALLVEPSKANPLLRRLGYGERDAFLEHCWVKVKGDVANGEGYMRVVSVLFHPKQQATARETIATKLGVPLYNAQVKFRDARSTPNLRVMTHWRLNSQEEWRALFTGDE